MAPDPEEPTPDEPTPEEPTPEEPAAGEPPLPYDPSVTPPPAGLSTGAGIGIGVGIGCGAHVVALVLMLATIFIGSSNVQGPTFLGITWPFMLVALAAIVMLFWKKTRGIAIGILIVAAAAWIVVLGPCLGMVGI